MDWELPRHHIRNVLSIKEEPEDRTKLGPVDGAERPLKLYLGRARFKTGTGHMVPFYFRHAKHITSQATWYINHLLKLIAANNSKSILCQSMK